MWDTQVWYLGQEDSGGGHGNPLQYSCLENPHRQRTLAGYSPWGCKESDTTEQLNTVQQCLSAPSILLYSGIHFSFCYIPEVLNLAVKSTFHFIGFCVQSLISLTMFCFVFVLGHRRACLLVEYNSSEHSHPICLTISFIALSLLVPNSHNCTMNMTLSAKIYCSFRLTVCLLSI